MKKRILSICLALIMCIGLMTNINLPQSVQAAGSETGDNEVPFDTPNDGVYGILTYETKDDGTIRITGCTDNNAESIDIPEYIDDMPVTEIASYTFDYMESLTTVVLPDTLKEIGGFVFDGCTSLTDITIPEGVETIRGYAFCGCTSLVSVVLPESVVEVGGSCFSGCSSLEELIFLNAGCRIDYSGNYSMLTGLVIGGYSGSTAEAFAKQYKNLIFVPIDLPLISSVEYRTHVQTYGWESEWCYDGDFSGTEGEAKRLEAIQIRLYDQPLSGNIEYRTHVQTYGWESTWRKNGETSGTSGEAKRLEAIEIRLTGEMAQKYDVYYRVHSQTFGWQGWAKNGSPAGTAGYAKRLEAIQIIIVYKGFLESMDIDMDEYLNYIDGSASYKTVQYATHVQSYGWKLHSVNGEINGTTGEAKRLEAIRISLPEPIEVGGVEYRTHVQSYGWENTWKKNGEISGTEGEAKRLEAIQIRLTGELAKNYDIYYRVHAQSYGWLGWAKNGQSAGTEGLAKRLEAIQIVVVKKGQPAPGSTANPFVKK